MNAQAAIEKRLTSSATLNSSVEVCIPTATIIAVSKNNRFLVLTGENSKHRLPVLPGGKIDLQDLCGSRIEEAAMQCAVRELKEEIHVEASGLRLFKVVSDGNRDMRIVSAQSLRSTLVEALVAGLATDVLVLGRYGVPDFLHVGIVNPVQVSESDELKNLRWVDVRKISAGELDAGHGDYLQAYAQCLRGPF